MFKLDKPFLVLATQNPGGNYTDGSGTLGGTFTLTPNTGGISFNFYIGYSLYGGFLNLPSDVWVQ